MFDPMLSFGEICVIGRKDFRLRKYRVVNLSCKKWTKQLARPLCTEKRDCSGLGTG